MRRWRAATPPKDTHSALTQATASLIVPFNARERHRGERRVERPKSGPASAPRGEDHPFESFDIAAATRRTAGRLTPGAASKR